MGEVHQLSDGGLVSWKKGEKTTCMFEDNGWHMSFEASYLSNFSDSVRSGSLSAHEQDSCWIILGQS